jgi:hypothetical protein
MSRRFLAAVAGMWLVLSSRFMRSATPRTIHRQHWRVQAFGMGVRVDARLRARLRRAWLRLVPHR